MNYRNRTIKSAFKFHMNEWWVAATSCTFGTIIGIVLTVGITYWQQKGDEEDMSRKISKITLHNLDVRIDQLDTATQLLASKDSIFRELTKRADNFSKMNPDSIFSDLNMLAQTQFMLSDTKSESIFSHSFEVWQYLADEKIIGRISNCYSMVDFDENLMTETNNRISDALYGCQLKIIEEGINQDPVKMARLLITDPQTILAFERVPKVVSLLTSTTRIARQLNQANKEALGLTDSELEKVGNLLDKNSHDI